MPTHSTLFLRHITGEGLRRQLRMAARNTDIAAIALGLTMMLLAFQQAVAQSNGCSSVMMTLQPCLDFIGTKSTEPGFTCCTALAGVVQTDPRCLCMVMDGSAASMGISINHTRAVSLPGLCKVQAPPVSQCKGVPAPLAAPATSVEAEDADAPKGSASPNATSSSRKSKIAASLMATMLIPACALLYVF